MHLLCVLKSNILLDFLMIAVGIGDDILLTDCQAGVTGRYSLCLEHEFKSISGRREIM
jgi:hypothetical protein